MLRLIFFLSLFSIGFAGQITSIYGQIVCDTSNSAWTSWFNTRDPLMNNGNDIEDFSIIRKLNEEAARCDAVLNVDYAIVQSSNNEAGFYQTQINAQGLFCMGSESARCPNYKVRFCCPLSTVQMMTNQCGYTAQQPALSSSARIVNGFEARPHSFPWAVSLQYKGLHDCGGVIVDQWNILTAAHCLDYSNDLSNYLVRIGAHNRLTSGQTKRIARLIIHPEYDEYKSINDIGIIRLAEPIQFNDHVQPICLLDSILEPELNANVYVVGWGNTVHQVPTSSSPVLLQARLRVITDCSMYFAYDSQKQICTTSNGPANKDHGSCQGDSGGGLFYNRNGRWYAAGVVSYAIGCGRQAFPTVFTKTSAYINWIRMTINLPITT